MFGNKGMGGMGGGFGLGGPGGFHAFDINGPEGVLELAMSVLKLAETNKPAAVELARILRESVISMAIASALVTQLQDPENPIISTEAEGDAPQNDPGELLMALAEGFPGMQETWDTLVETFKLQWNNYIAEKELKNIPKDFFVSDILGEPKED